MTEDKDTLRRDLRLRRRQFVTGTDLHQLRVHGIVMARIALEAASQATRVACYLSNPYEVDAMPILQLACARGIMTALPHIGEREGPMRFLRWQPGGRLATGPYGIPQPMKDAEELEPDAIISPLVGFDRAGNRLGQGGGFYDRAFAAFPEARRIGLAWSVQESDAVPVDSWDERLHVVVTERERIDFS
jgi:5-formyltetrahydrofolate cyclo-ligase